MSTWLTFWRSAAAWTGCAVVLVLLSSFFGAFTRDYGIRGWPAAVLAIAEIPAWIAAFLPLAVLPAGIAAATDRGVASAIGRRSRMPLVVVAGTSALLVFMLSAYGAPAVAAWGARHVRMPMEAGVVTMAETRSQMRAAYELAVAEARRDPQYAASGWSAPWHRAYQLGYAYHLQTVMVVLTIVMLSVGMLIGRLSVSASQRAWRTIVQRWAIAALVVLWVTAGIIGGHELSTQLFVPPALTAYGVLIVPFAVAVALGWAAWVEGVSRDSNTGWIGSS